MGTSCRMKNSRVERHKLRFENLRGYYSRTVEDQGLYEPKTSFSPERVSSKEEHWEKVVTKAEHATITRLV
jgi:hypothetical protein